MKQSSVEWLDRWFRDNPEATHEEGNAALTQAKEMHKEEIKTSMSVAFLDGLRSGDENYKAPYEDWEKYYNETFGGEQ